MSIQSILSKLEDLKADVSNISQSSRIGIAISTYNRYETFKKTYSEIQIAPPNSIIVVVDDASDSQSEATFRFEKNIGIARVKNKCFELLYNEAANTSFCSTMIAGPKRIGMYLMWKVKEPHLNYIFEQFKSLNAPKQRHDCDL